MEVDLRVNRSRVGNCQSRVDRTIHFRINASCADDGRSGNAGFGNENACLPEAEYSDAGWCGTPGIGLNARISDFNSWPSAVG